MIAFLLGKIIYKAADKVRSDEKNRDCMVCGFALIAAAGVFRMCGPGHEGWAGWLSELKFGDVIILAVTIGTAMLAATAFACWVFNDKLNKICGKFSHAAQSYDLFMLARVRIGERDQSGPTAYGKGVDAKVGIEYFLESEKTKSLYNASGGFHI